MFCVCDMYWDIAGCRNYDCSKMWWNFETAVYYEVYTRADQCSCQALNSLISHWPSIILSDVSNENKLIDGMPMMKRIIQNKIIVPEVATMYSVCCWQLRKRLISELMHWL